MVNLMSKPTKYYSSIQENKVAKHLGWSVVSGSGARPFHKADIFNSEFLGECKTHVDKCENIVFKLEHWDKINKEAMSDMKCPILFTDNGTQSIDFTYCLLPYTFLSTRLYSDEYEITQLDLDNKFTNIMIPIDRLVKDSNIYDNILIYKSKLGKSNVGIISLNDFKELIYGD